MMNEIDVLCTDLLMVMLTVLIGITTVCAMIWVFFWFVNAITDQVLDIVKKVKKHVQD